MKEDTLEDTLDHLITLIQKDLQLFYRTYKSLPFPVYCEIENLSVSKSSVSKGLCKKAKTVANSFHKSIK